MAEKLAPPNIEAVTTAWPPHRNAGSGPRRRDHSHPYRGRRYHRLDDGPRHSPHPRLQFHRTRQAGHRGIGTNAQRPQPRRGWNLRPFRPRRRSGSHHQGLGRGPGAGHSGRRRRPGGRLFDRYRPGRRPARHETTGRYVRDRYRPRRHLGHDRGSPARPLRPPIGCPGSGGWPRGCSRCCWRRRNGYSLRRSGRSWCRRRSPRRPLRACGPGARWR